MQWMEKKKKDGNSFGISIDLEWSILVRLPWEGLSLVGNVSHRGIPYYNPSPMWPEILFARIQLFNNSNDCWKMKQDVFLHDEDGRPATDATFSESLMCKDLSREFSEKPPKEKEIKIQIHSLNDADNLFFN